MNNINPNWKTILDKIPAEFHNQILPDLQAWDKGVQDKITEVHGQYEELKPFKQFVDNNVDYDYAMNSVLLAEKLQQDPAGLVSQINQSFELGYLTKEEAEKLAPAGESTDDDFLDDKQTDIFADPRVKAMADSLEAIQAEREAERDNKTQEQLVSEFEKDLDVLQEKYEKPAEGDPLPFNRMFVTALMAQGMDGDAAVKQYHEILAGNVVADNKTTDDGKPTPPVVMGNGGAAGSGVGDGTVDFGSMSKNDFNDNVERLLAAQMNSGQG